MAIVLSPDFREFLRLLNEHQVEYLILGGYAVGYHGYPRATQDLDIWISRNPGNPDKMVQVLSTFGYDVVNIDKGLFYKKETIFRMGVPPIRIEIFTDASGVDFNECYRDRITSVIDGLPVNVIGRQHLIVNKKASGRLKDLADLEALGEPPTP